VNDKSHLRCIYTNSATILLDYINISRLRLTGPSITTYFKPSRMHIEQNLWLW